MRRAVTAVPVVALLGVSIGSAAATPSHHANGPDTQPAPGIYVSGHGRVPGLTSVNSNLVTDYTGRVHLIGSSSPDHRHPANYSYYTAAEGHRTFTHRPVSYHQPVRTHQVIRDVLSTNAKQLEASFSSCHGIDTTATPVHSKALPKPKLAVPGRGCDPDDGPAVSLAGIAAMPHNLMALLVADTGDNIHDGSTPAALQLWEGKPGSAFSLAPQQPTGVVSATSIDGGSRLAGFTRDPATGALDIVLSTEAVGATTISLSTQAAAGEAWTDPTVIASLPKSESTDRDWAVSAVTAYGGTVTVAVRPQVPKQGRHPAKSVHGTYSLLESVDGAAATTTPLPASTSTDDGLRLFTNPRNGHLHAAFDRVDGSNSGIYAETFDGMIWSDLIQVVAGRNVDIADLALTQHGDPVVSYEVE